MKKNIFPPMIACLLYSLSLIACTSENLNPEVIKVEEFKSIYENLSYGQKWYITEDTIINEEDITLHQANQSISLSAINGNAELDYVAIGGSFTSGARNSGLYRNAQLTSFPNLLARQMNISTFNQPLFGKEESNGFGYKLLSTNLPNRVPAYVEVKNNLAISSSDTEITLSEYSGPEVNNLGVPYLGSYGLSWLPSYPPKNSVGYELKAPIPFLGRFVSSNEEQNSILKKVLNRKPNFFTIEIGTDNFLNGTNTDVFQSAFKPALLSIIEHFDGIQAKGLIANIPDVTSFPFFHFIKPIDVRNTTKIEFFVRSNGTVVSVPNESLLLPTPIVDSMLNLEIKGNNKTGLSYDKPLPEYNVWLPEDIQNTQNSIKTNNEVLESWAAKHNFPIVDLRGLFEAVGNEEYITHDGISLNDQVFFSSDGINLSPLGQAVVANEFIKKLNSFYHTEVPLIPTSFYSNK